jgi:hypothetical protein
MAFSKGIKLAARHGLKGWGKVVAGEPGVFLNLHMHLPKLKSNLKHADAHQHRMIMGVEDRDRATTSINDKPRTAD